MKKLIHCLLFISLVVLLTNCNKDNNTNTANGTMRMYLADGPIDDSNVKGVYITVKSVDVNVNGNWTTLSGFSNPITYNLMDLRDSNAVFLGQTSLPAGSYSEIRFVLQAPEDMNSNPSNPGCYILYKDNTTQPLFVPSGSSSGFKAKGNFDVPSNGTVDLVSDFDVRKSIVQAGGSGKFLLKPVIHIDALNQAGAIRGTVSNHSTYQQLVVFAYTSGSYTSAEASAPSSGSTRFPNAVTSASVNSTNSFILPYLAPGKYTLVVTGYKNGDFDSILGFVKDVNVTSKNTTAITLDTNTLSPTP